MAYLQCDFFSTTLELACSLTACIPEPPATLPAGAPRPTYPVLYLLHGLSDDHTIWLRRTSIERYAAARGLAVIMPAAHRSFYTNMVHGPRYFDFISEELPRLASSLFPISTLPAQTYVAGLSMGGYGAFKLALECPTRYAAAASLSGALDLPGEAMRDIRTTLAAEMNRVFGDVTKLAGSPYDHFARLRQRVAAGTPLPRLYACCGTEDFLYPDHVNLVRLAAELGLPLTHRASPGVHDWAYWDREIPLVLDWLLAQPKV